MFLFYTVSHITFLYTDIWLQFTDPLNSQLSSPESDERSSTGCNYMSMESFIVFMKYWDIKGYIYYIIFSFAQLFMFKMFYVQLKWRLPLRKREKRTLKWLDDSFLSPGGNSHRWGFKHNMNNQLNAYLIFSTYLAEHDTSFLWTNYWFL
jgi:hypothetical protein